MSAYGVLDVESIKARFKRDSDGAAKIFSQMTIDIVGLERRVDSLQSDLIACKHSEGCAKASEARLQGYVDRVKDLDPPVPEPERRQS